MVEESFLGGVGDEVETDEASGVVATDEASEVVVDSDNGARGVSSTRSLFEGVSAQPSIAEEFRLSSSILGPKSSLGFPAPTRS